MAQRMVRWSVLIVVVLLAAQAVPAVSAAEAPDRAKVTVRLAGTFATGATQPTCWDDLSLNLGEAKTATLHAGFDASGGFVSGAGASPTPGQFARMSASAPRDSASGWKEAVQGYRYTWKTQVRLVSIAGDAIKLEIDWHRYERRGTRCSRAQATRGPSRSGRGSGMSSMCSVPGLLDRRSPTS